MKVNDTFVYHVYVCYFRQASMLSGAIEYLDMAYVSRLIVRDYYLPNVSAMRNCRKDDVVRRPLGWTLIRHDNASLIIYVYTVAN